MSKISAHFDRQEFACHCGGECPQSKDPTVDVKLIGLLEELRGHFGAPITVTSGVRCKTHNEAVGGRAFSKHLEGKASDVIVKGVHSHTVYKYLTERYPDTFGFGKYNTFTHLDCRSGRAARWEIKG